MFTDMPIHCEIVAWFVVPAGILAWVLIVHHTITGARRFKDHGWDIVRGIFSGRYAQ